MQAVVQVLTEKRKTKQSQQENKQECTKDPDKNSKNDKKELGKTKENKNNKQNEREKDNITNRKIKYTEEMGRKMILKGKESKI